MRRVKTNEELEVMTRACRLVDEVMGEVTPQVTGGVTELELARDIDFRMRSKGTRAPSFDTGVWSMGPASGRDATVRISGGAVERGLAVSFDFGSVVDGYCSDFGRTVQVGEASAEFSRVYDTVMEAQAAGIRAGDRARSRLRCTRRHGRSSSTPGSESGSGTVPVIASAWTCTNGRLSPRRTTPRWRSA